jgi:hypothetical protein
LALLTFPAETVFYKIDYRKYVAYIYFAFVWVFAIAFVVVICVSKNANTK